MIHQILQIFKINQDGKSGKERRVRALNKSYFYVFALTLLFALSSNAQIKTRDPLLKWTTWAFLQAIPSPTYFEDRNGSNSRLKFGLEWQIIPFSYSFNMNKYVSQFNFFFINPVKRFTGSIESFFEPSITLGDFKYAALKKFMFKAGARVVLPVAEKGEYFAVSLGAGYYMQKKTNNEITDGITYEAGAYTLFGMLGLKFNYNQNAISRYNIGLYIKYY